MQILALLPGISRDGVVMVSGLFRGLSMQDAARFSFLLSAPVILAAGVLKIPDLTGPLGTGVRGQVLAGSIVSGVGAYLALRFFMRYVSNPKRTLTPFAIYCLVVGLGSAGLSGNQVTRLAFRLPDGRGCTLESQLRPFWINEVNWRGYPGVDPGSVPDPAGKTPPREPAGAALAPAILDCRSASLTTPRRAGHRLRPVRRGRRGRGSGRAPWRRGRSCAAGRPSGSPRRTRRRRRTPGPAPG